MARAFAAGSDVVTLSPGTAAGITFGTFGLIVRRGSDSGGGSWTSLMTIWTGGTPRASVTFDGSDNLAFEGGPGDGSSAVSLKTADGWALVTWSKATGSAAINVQKYLFATDAWSTGSISAMGNWTGGTSLQIGQGISSAFDGDIAVAGVWGRALSDAEIKNLPFSLHAWHAAAPNGLWVLDQSLTTQAVGDLTGGGANQSAITGTTVSTSSVPVFNIGDGPVLVTRSQAAAPPPPTSRRTLPLLGVA
jgi:hypothetical protein